MTLHHGDCLEVMAIMPDASVDAIATDPPYGLGFMGKAWDHGVPGVPFWAEMLRVAKPGAHLLAFGGTRTMHRIASAIEDAGWEIRDTLVWAYASGFPKSLDVSKALDKVAGAEREVVGRRRGAGNGAVVGMGTEGSMGREYDATEPATDLARQWEGWGTALKPAWEPIVMARKPLAGSVARNVLEHGTGALNIDGTRIGTDADTARPAVVVADTPAAMGKGLPMGGNGSPLGRWPANVILTDPIFDGDTPGVVGGGESQDGVAVNHNRELGTMSSWYGTRASQIGEDVGYGGGGTYSRFFLIPKADRAQREPIVRGQRIDYEHSGPRGHSLNGDGTPRAPSLPRTNVHPTVKPVDLMRHLVRLVTPPGGTVLDPFLGSGTTAIAAELEGFAWIGIEREAEYVAIAEARLNGTQRGLGLDVLAPTRRPPKTHPDIAKHRPKRRAASENYTGGWMCTEEEAV